jgi:hypothetical protein
MTGWLAGARTSGRVALVLVACLIGVLSSLGASSSGRASSNRAEVGVLKGVSCTHPQSHATVVGKPHLSSVPTLAAVTLSPHNGGLGIVYRFRKPLVVAPAGVLIAWRVFIYRNRNDANQPASGVTLTVQDRGAGWEPSGWTITTALGANLGQVDGNVYINKARDELSVFFPKGFANLRTPFFWYSNEWEIRGFLPTKNNKPDYTVNGSVSFDCPAGINASGQPDPKLLIHAAA